MYSIAEIFDNSKQLLDSVDRFIKLYIGSTLLRKCNILKLVDSYTRATVDYDYCDSPLRNLIGNIETSKILENCISAKRLLRDKLLACFASMSMYFMFKNDMISDYKQDTYYRFDRMPKANWERLQLETARNVINDIEDRMSDNHINVLIFDDSLYRRRRGKGTDLCARVFDHCDHKMRLGYRMMTGGWSNGDVFIPFSQVLLSTREERNMIGKDDPVDKRTLRGKRRELAKQKGTQVVHSMVQSATEAGIPFDYVLFDTWFSNPAQLLDLKEIGADVIAMIKKSSTKYIWKDPDTGEFQKLNTKEIYSRSKKRVGRSKYLLSVEVTVSDATGREIPARLVYARNTHNRKEWVCFICTDMSIDEETILRAYSMRWNIETYFKMSKSYLKLRTECHSPSYDAITAHMVVVALRYMILAVERFNNTDNRSIMDLFYQIKREIICDIMDKAIIIIVDALLNSVRKLFNATDKKMKELVCLFIEGLPRDWQQRFMLPADV